MADAPVFEIQPEPNSGFSVLMIDAPNVDATVGHMWGRAPRRSERFDPEVLSRWAGELAGSSVERTLFTNVPDPIPPGLEGWIKSLVDSGWRVYARPKRRRDDDIDDAMVAHLMGTQWSRVIVFSHDSACFAKPLEALHRSGTDVTVLGFKECAGRLPHLNGPSFVDVSQVPGLYAVEPPRVRVADLPTGGGWIERVAG